MHRSLKTEPTYYERTHVPYINQVVAESRAQAKATTSTCREKGAVKQTERGGAVCPTKETRGQAIPLKHAWHPQQGGRPY